MFMTSGLEAGRLQQKQQQQQQQQQQHQPIQRQQRLVQEDIMRASLDDVEDGDTSMEGQGDLEVERKARMAWDSKLQYFFMIISYAVGLGNVWRFPYLTQMHGGGAFMIPYLIMLFLEGMPVLYLELAIGQRMRMGCVGVWNNIHPFLGGVGVASAVTSFTIAIYYNAIIMWCFFYLFHSFQTPLPWASCPLENATDNNSLPIPECELSGSTSYFWYREALDISGTMEDSGGIKWKILLCHVFAWIVIYLCICKGIKSSGKVVYVTATFPYVVLLIFFIRGITLDGAMHGLIYMFTPKMDQLMNVQCWLDAAAQIFFSFGLAFGGLIAFSSYNPMHNNVQKDALIVGITNWASAILVCMVIFAVIGFKATVMHRRCVDYNIHLIGAVCEISTEALCQEYSDPSTITREVYQHVFEPNLTSFDNLTARKLRNCSLEGDLSKGVEGTGLAFIIFTQAINEFGSAAPFWSIVFFLMLLSLGLGSEFGTIEGVTTSLYDLDLFPWMRKKWLVSAILCTTCCLVGFLFVLGSGAYWVALFDTFAGTFPLIVVALVECIAVGWVLGVNRFSNEIAIMIGHKPSFLWQMSWKFISPVVLVTLLFGTLIIKFSNPITYKAYNSITTLMEPQSYPWYAGFVAVFLVLASILWIPAIALLRYCGLLEYDHAKVLASRIRRTTPSTVKFLANEVGRPDDRDSGHNSEDDQALREPGTSTPFFLERHHVVPVTSHHKDSNKRESRL